MSSKISVDDMSSAALKVSRSSKKRTPSHVACDPRETASRKLARRSSGGQRVNVYQGRLESQRVTVKRKTLERPDKLAGVVHFRESSANVGRAMRCAQAHRVEHDQAFLRLVFRLGLDQLEALARQGVRIDP